jgi:hypothetical protein
MNPTKQLKLSAIAFTVVWAGWMLWWSGSLDPANVIILAICGAAAGYFWYRAMRWIFTGAACARRMKIRSNR